MHIAAIISTTWILLMNGAVGYQLLDDGTVLSLALIFGSAAILFVGTGYIALDTGFSWTGYWDDTLAAPNRSYSLYTLYQLVPLVFLTIFFCLEAVIVVRVLGEKRPMCKLERQSVILIKLTWFQSTSSLQCSCSPLDKSSNTSSASIFAMPPMEPSTEVSSSHCSLCSPSS